MADETTIATQGEPEGEAAVTPAETTAPEGTEQTAQPVETPAAPEPEKPKPATPAWAQRRIDELTRKFHEEKRRADALAAGTQPQPDGQTATRTPETDVEKRAAQLVAQREFDKQCNTAWEAGTTKYGADFDSALGTLRTMGVLRPEVVEAALATDHAPDVLHYLGSNPDEADRILSLPPTRMAVELVKVAQTATKPKPVSAAPAPIKPVGGSRQVSEEPGDDDDDATWMKKREAQIRKRTA